MWCSKMSDEKKQIIASEQIEMPLDPSIIEWLESTNKHVKRMSQDEAYRKEVAKDLS
jgi:hypothetical protein